MAELILFWLVLAWDSNQSHLRFYIPSNPSKGRGYSKPSRNAPHEALSLEVMFVLFKTPPKVLPPVLALLFFNSPKGSEGWSSEVIVASAWSASILVWGRLPMRDAGLVRGFLKEILILRCASRQGASPRSQIIFLHSSVLLLWLSINTFSVL